MSVWGNRPYGWPGQWPPPQQPGVPLPPGFPGPPPLPPGVQNPVWHSGSWHFNPAFVHNSNAPNPQSQPWAAGMAWGPQYRPSHGPIRPRDPTYFNTELKDNPLGLENMIPRRDDRERENAQDGTPQTPWIWNPPGLVSDRESTNHPVASNLGNGQDRRESGHSRHHSSSRPPDAREPVNIYRDSTPRDNTPRPPPDQRPPQDIYRDPANRPLGRPSDPNSAYHRRPQSSQQHHPPRPDTYPSSNPNNGTITDRELQNRRASEGDMQQLESYTARMVLTPTFSPSIVRTPRHYVDSSRRHSTDDNSDRYSSTAPQGGDVPRPERPRVSSSTSNLTRQSSLPESSSSLSSSSIFTGLPHFSSEPASLLSPLVGATPRQSTRDAAIAGALRRHDTEPLMASSNSLSSIPEALPNREARFEALMFPDVPDPNLIPVRARRSTPHPRRGNPLPPPPAEVHIPVEVMQSSRATPSFLGGRGRRVRKGFWNRRGDHVVVPSGKVVYAPHDRANPPELADYPVRGYRDELGEELRFSPREELPESLPLQGRPPARPYDSFVQYIEI